jgi:hypothetical protein
VTASVIPHVGRGRSISVVEATPDSLRSRPWLEGSAYDDRRESTHGGTIADSSARRPAASGTLASNCVDGRRRLPMSEMENLGGVLREIRSAVSGDASLYSLVADLAYGVDVPDARGGVTSIEAGLARLAGSRPPPALAYRRVLVVAALAKARPQRFGRGGTHKKDAVAALQPATRDRSQRLGEAAHALVCERVEEGEDPQEIKRTLFTAGLARRILPLAVEGSTATVSSPAGATRTRLIAATPVPGFKLRHVDRLLDPANWNELSCRRITMTPYPGGELTDDTKRLYYEVFRVSNRLKLTPRLRVVRHKTVDIPAEAEARSAQWLEYRLADAQSPGELVKVDQGSIVIREVGDGVRIETTKRVLFTPPFDGPGLALQADLLGYFDAFEQMVRRALESPSMVPAA